MQKELVLKKALLERFVDECRNKFPKKAFGYFISSSKGGSPEDFIMFRDDVRNEWKSKFEEYGNYYVLHDDAGFLATEEEMYEVHKILSQRKMHIVGIYHSHQRHPAIFSTVDIDLHPSENIWHLIISLRNKDNPQIKAFSVKNSMPSELKIVSE